MILQISYQKASAFCSDHLRAFFFFHFLCLQLHSNFFPDDNTVLQASLNETAKLENMHYHLNILITTAVFSCSLYLLGFLSCQETMNLERRLLCVTRKRSTSVCSFLLSMCLLYSVEFSVKNQHSFLNCCPLCGLLLVCTEPRVHC